MQSMSIGTRKENKQNKWIVNVTSLMMHLKYQVKTMRRISVIYKPARFSTTSFGAIKSLI